jgi:hypothetical protein
MSLARDVPELWSVYDWTKFCEIKLLLQTVYAVIENRGSKYVGCGQP